MGKIDKKALNKSIKQKNKSKGRIIFKTCENCFTLDCECLKDINKQN